MGIPFHDQDNSWGEAEVVLTSPQTGLSLTQPRVSPDGRFLQFTTANHGAFPVLENESDIWLMDLKTFKYWRMNCNSPRTESWHCWSSNSRWTIFSSKRGNGLLARPHICYIAPDGTEGKPFVMPQKDPFFYDSFIKTYNLPELITGPVTVSSEELAKAALSESYRAVIGATVRQKIKQPTDDK
jgi:hypothetical protein